jgi:hypothetical protein
MTPVILIIVCLSIVLVFVVMSYNSIIKKEEPPKQEQKSGSIRKPNAYQLTEYYKGIGIEPYGCFSSLDEKFFQKQHNEYTNVTDSLLIIDDTDRELKQLIMQVIDNGYNIYGFKMLNKYDPDKYRNISIEEVAVLAKLSGYNYLSVFKLDENSRGKIYLSYSPPMDELSQQFDKSNLAKSDKPDYTLTPKLNQYTNEEEKAPGKQLSCGYPCTYNGKPLTFKDPDGNVRQYMCGSAGYPNIKTPSRFSVYKIVEK